MSVKISELPLLSTLSDNDILAGVDTSENVTSKVELSTLKNYIDTNTQYTAGTNIDITENVISAPNVYNKTETDETIKKLQDELDAVSTIYNAFPTVDEEDTSISLDGTAESKFKKLDLQGNTSQVSYTGKNLIDVTDRTITSQLAIANIDTSSITGNVTLSLNFINSGNINGVVRLRERGNDTNLKSLTLEANQSGTRSISLDVTSYNAIAIIFQGTTSGYSYSISNVQLEKGSTVTEFEPYVGGIPSPNPSYPQNVNVVSGDNEINICGKNTFMFDKFKEDNPNATITGTSDNFYYKYTDIASNYRAFFKDNTQYQISGEWSTTNGNMQMKVYFTDGSSQIMFENYSSSSASGTFNKTTTSNKTIDYIRFITWGSGNITIKKLQIEIGNNKTTYEPYIGNTYPIYLGVENLSPISSLSTTNGGYINASTGHFGDVIAGHTYTVHFKNNSSYTNQLDVRVFHENTYTSQLNKNLVANGIVEFTFTASNTGYIALNGKVASDTTDIFTEIKTTEGNHLQYISTNPIELCKIGDYQDYIYKDNGSWYLHKEIGKVVLNGSENWGKSSSTANTIFYLSGTINYKNGTTSSSTDLYCNYFDGKIVWGNNVVGCELYVVNSIRFGLTTSSTITTLEDWKTWLSSHNTIVYYVLSTPTNTEITDTTLISQLEALKNATSYETQTNISQENNDKPFIINAEAILSLKNILD